MELCFTTYHESSYILFGAQQIEGLHLTPQTETRERENMVKKKKKDDKGEYEERLIEI